MVFLAVNRGWRLLPTSSGAPAMFQTEPGPSRWRCWPNPFPADTEHLAQRPGFPLQYSWKEELVAQCLGCFCRHIDRSCQSGFICSISPFVGIHSDFFKCTCSLPSEFKEYLYSVMDLSIRPSLLEEKTRHFSRVFCSLQWNSDLTSETLWGNQLWSRGSDLPFTKGHLYFLTVQG